MREILQHRITGQVAVRVVDLLEVIDVEHHERQRMAVAARDRDLALEELHEEALVVDPGHPVLDGHVVDRFVVRALDVAAREELVDRVAEPDLVAVVQLLAARVGHQ